MPKSPKKKYKLRPTAVGIHIYAGGFTVGVKQAGFDVLCHLEIGKYGVASVKANWPALPVHIGEENWPLKDLAKKEVDLLYSNPPCAIFSVAGTLPSRSTHILARCSWSAQVIADAACNLFTQLNCSITTQVLAILGCFRWILCDF